MIRREIEVTRKGLPRPIDVTYGTNLIPIEFVVTDFAIPEGVTAKLYAMGASKVVKSQDAEVSGNKITFTPEIGFFDERKNVLQIAIEHEGKNLFSFEQPVTCHYTMKYTGALNLSDGPTFVEMVLELQKEVDEIKKNGTGGVSEEQIKNAVNEYLDENPVASGATEEQAAQIEQNKSKIEQIQEDVKNKEESGTAENKVTEHNVSTVSHNDIRLLIKNLTNAFEAYMDIDDESMNQATEFVAYMKDNRELIERVTTSKVSVSDIVDDYVTNVSNKPVSAAVAVKLKALIDAITVPTVLSQLGQDATHRTVTDAEKETWNNKANKATTLAGYGIADGATKEEVSQLSEQINKKATTQYVDEKVKNVQVDLTGYATEKYVDNEINDLKAQGVQQIPLFAQGETREEELAWLTENGDTSKVYVMKDNSIFEYKNVTSTGSMYTNVLKNKEFYINKRWSHSKNGLSDANGHVVFDYIPVKFGDVVRINLPHDNMHFSYDYNRVHYFDSSFNYASGHIDAAPEQIFALTEENENVTSFVVGYECTTQGNDSTNTKIAGADNIAYMNWIYNIAFCLDKPNQAITEDEVIASNLIMTINEPIEETTIAGFQWVDTGRKFVPADYEDRIIDLEEKSAEHDEKILALEKAVTSGGIDNTLTEAYNRIKNWKYPIHEDAPVFLLDTDKPAIASDEQNTEGVYAKYDALMNANSHYITREDCGMASDGTTPIYVYHFKEPEPHYSSQNWSETKPVILVCSGVHPTEQTGVHSLYHAMEEITNNVKLLDLRRNIHFVIMPLINPTAFSDSTYGVRNPDGIQVHYNFEVDFKYPTDAGYVAQGNRNHGGETPLSIPETQYFNSLMEEYKDTLACVVSCHNNDVDEQYGTGFVWCSCATHFMCNLGFRFVDKMSVAWREKYGTAFDDGIRWANDYALTQSEAGSSIFNSTYTKEQAEWDYRVGRASISGSGGTEYKQALKYGIHGINVEVCDRCMVLDKDFSKKRTANVVTMGTETYINFFRTFMAVYDRKDKKDYAPNLPWVE